MIYLVLILLLMTVYFAVRFFSLSNSLKDANKQLNEVLSDMHCNRQLKCTSPHQELENFLLTMNHYLEASQRERISYANQERELRKQIENISHDLRTPLTSILGYLNLIEEDDLRLENQEYLDIAIKKSNYLNHLVSNFYDLSRLETNDLNLNFDLIDLRQCLLEHMLSFYQEFEDKGIHVEMDLGSGPIFTFLDQIALDRIITNLIQNALKYSTEIFYVSLHLTPDSVHVLFKNDAPDLNEADVQRLFDRFYMKDESRTKGSTGLGLTISKLLTESMAGKISSQMNEQHLEITLQFNSIRKKP